MIWQEWFALTGLILIGFVFLFLTITDVVKRIHYLKSQDITNNTYADKGYNPPKPEGMDFPKVVELNERPYNKCSTNRDTHKPPRLFRKLHAYIIERRKRKVNQKGTLPYRVGAYCVKTNCYQRPPSCVIIPVTEVDL
jgi:hypothetical protein